MNEGGTQPVGSLRDLVERGVATGKVGNVPVCVFWHEGRAFAVDDRCPHMGFPLHRGTVENGLLTCHWHNARFDLASGGTLDPWADDVRAYEVVVDGDGVSVRVPAAVHGTDHLVTRLVEGLEQGLTLVTAKAVLALLEAGAEPAEVVRVGIDFGVRYRERGWGAGLTVLTAMANVLPSLDPADRPLALVQGLIFVARDTAGHPPRFPLLPLGRGVPAERLPGWYRRFVETRSADAAERVLASAIAAGMPPVEVEQMMTAAATDHVFLDEGHTLDFTNKAFEAVARLGWNTAGDILPTLVRQTAGARRHEEDGAWRHPFDLAGLVAAAVPTLPERVGDTPLADADVRGIAERVLDDDPARVVAAVVEPLAGGASAEAVARAVALAAALRITRFHVQNDHGDWDVVHHGFTHASSVHQALVRAPSPALLRGIVHAALKVFLDRFLNVPAARLPQAAVGGTPPPLDDLARCWDEQGRVDDAGRIAYQWVLHTQDQGAVIAALGRALLAEDAGFHWFQTYEAAVRQASAWPAGSEEAALILAGAARFLAAHTPTRREDSHVVRIATRLRRGEPLFDEGDAGDA